jgi:hypothetical protein
VRRFLPRCRAVLQVILDGLGGEDSDPIVVTALPKAATVHKNAYRIADTFELTFDAGDLPFDPRLLRTGFAQVHMYQVDSNEGRTQVHSRQDPYSDANVGGSRGDGGADLAIQEADALGDRGRFADASRPLVAGLFDSAALELSGDGKWLSIKGQDLTAHLSAIQWKPNPNGTARRIPIGKRLDLLIADLLEEADFTGFIGLDVRGIPVDQLPVVGAAEVRGSARGIPVEQNTSYWDVISKLAERYGFIAFIDGVDVVLTRPKTITDTLLGNIKSLVWGRNVEYLSLEREIGKVQTPTVIVESYDETTRTTIRIEYPPGQLDHGRTARPSPSKVHGSQSRAKTTERHKAKAASKKKGKTTTTLTKRDEYQILTVNGIRDPEILENVARNHYHEVGRGERKVIAKTRDLSDTENRDMLNLTAGDAVTIDWDDFDRSFIADDSVTDSTKVEALVRRGFNRSVAATVVRYHAQLVGISRPLRVKDATYEWSIDSGIDIELELHDFIVIDGLRHDDGSDAGALRKLRRQERMVKHDGSPIGWTADEREAAQRRYRP